MKVGRNNQAAGPGSGQDEWRREEEKTHLLDESEAERTGELWAAEDHRRG